MLQELPCYERQTQALFLICDRKHDEINPVRKVTRFKNVPMAAEWTVGNALGPNFTISQYKLGFRWFNSRFTVHGSQVQYSLTLSRQLNYIIQYNVETNDLSTMVSCI